MGFNLSKQGPGSADNIGALCVERQLLHYFSRSFFLRKLVSKKRRRMLVGGYDLDMSYITDRVLAMSFPAERMRAMYRNPMWQVKSVLDMSHPGHYKVFNLCIEQAYDPSHFHGRVERYPFDDNHVPPLYMIKEFCESVDSWLSLHSKNIAVVHCMAGKGRTGLMVSAYLVYIGMHAEDALQMYADKRTTNNEGVSIPSQRRYVSYWEKLLSYQRGGVHSGLPFIDLAKPCSRELRRVRLYDAVNTESVFFVVSQLEEVPAQRYRPQVEVSRNCCRRIKKGGETTEYDRCYYSISDSDEEGKKPESKEPHLVAQMDTESPVIYQKTCLDYNYEKPIQVTGDVRLAFYEKMIGGRLFYACFNTFFINNSLLQFTVKDVDKIGKKGRSICGSAFCVELLFGPPNAVGVLSSSSDVSSSSDDFTP